MNPPSADAIVERVRRYYAGLAGRARAGAGVEAAGGGGCCGPTLYPAEELRDLPRGAVAASAGCANPIAVADLRAGDVVLDLGSGAGIDVLLSARRVGPTGKAFGLDMTDEMLELARENARRAGAHNIEFLRGRIEDVPLPDGSVDAVISNCVINLSTDKRRVLREAARVLRPGGRLAVADIVADHDEVPSDDWEGCAAGAITADRYRADLEAAGFRDVEIEASHATGPGLTSAIIRAAKPA
ncbi:MAG TPA: methyltransferase domain-containing protein [Actinomycetota bacterium]|nr:methyltransferase domain-containing protein [Actinomycetota bacterium]